MKTNTTDTPETDAHIVTVECEDSCCAIYVKLGGIETPEDLVPESFARKLERERDEVIAERDRWKKRYYDVADAVCAESKDCEDLCRQAREIRTERDAALRELEELRKDKERLDWLLKQGLCFRGADKFDENWRVGHETEWLYERQDARKTIDAAKQAQALTG